MKRLIVTRMPMRAATWLTSGRSLATTPFQNALAFFIPSHHATKASVLRVRGLSPVLY
ncbi:hypothetical protein XH83_37165 (plasmid) [Bradyrhizobium sp. CCBAU 53351]|uniref:Uncharacterized protein n=2 Tax=Bradyrhizobium TaxID=374 RepID=A0AAE5X916_9BRAD|nr:hypothetical protein X265_38845 [Bradyrhizobium guangdongense]QAU51075.1 hypothetical protein XH91_38045 [Bradyrhizobium guangzhouense]QOZ49339.1 hypothetical protein XH89_38215 [Bradyrhizobium sp. CCBAU 53340]QOZ57142.1 hypothetical protein XH90_38655 [Bradyrhizobium sp. CCBAU 53338]QOZ81098.1 hypothetical protein XH83_37165 [Bradyrhizobium sp. CCBAU 53351]